MSRRLGWAALASGMGLAILGALVAYLSAGGPWAVAGAVIGAVSGAFAPSAFDGIRKRGEARESLRGTAEQVPLISSGRLLDPRREVVGFVGREAELADLMAWCGNERSGPLRLVTGLGGVGKTRLAVELAQRMTECGWKCERVADGEEGQVIAALRAVTRGPALLVVDYAETRIGLRQMMNALTGDQGNGVKVLLLARSAGDWWDQLGVDQPGVWDLVQSAKSAELVLSPVVAADLSDADVIAQAVAAFAQELGVPARTVEIYGGRGRRRVLELHAAALVAVLAEGAAGTVRVDIGSVLDELLRHEMHFWYHTARASGLAHGPEGMSPLMLRQTVAASCLLGAATEKEARALPNRVPGLSSSSKAAQWLRELYPPAPGEPDWLGSLQPDRLAEVHTVRELAASPELASACLASLDARQARRAVTLLARASSGNAQAATLLRQILPGVADFIVGLDASRETLAAIANAIPHPTVVLAPAAAAISRQVVTLLPADSTPALRAYWLSTLELRLSEVGYLTDAVAVAEEAIALYRELAAVSPDRYRPDLARSLFNLGQTCSELGRPADALPVAGEAAAIYRELDAASPGLYRADLAGSLINLGMLSELRCPADVLPLTEEGVAIYRELDAISPDRHRHHIARALVNLGFRFSEMGRPADALPVTEEAVAMYRELVAASPDQHRPGLALSLDKLGVTLAELGRPADALPVTEEAVAIYRELADILPDRYRPDLAASLGNLGMRLSELDRPADALTAEQETFAMYQKLTAVSPDRYRPDLAGSLINLGSTLSELGRPADARPVTEEAVAMFRELAFASPDRYRPDLALSLDNLGMRFSELGCPGDALPVTEEAVAIRRELSAASPDRYGADLAQSLDNFGSTLSELDRLADALPVTEEAVAIYRQLATSGPGRYRTDLATALVELGIRLSELGRPGDALPVTEEAVAIRRELAAADPDRHRLGLALSLAILSLTLSELGCPSDALPVMEEVVALYRELAAASPDRHRNDLALSLDSLAGALAALDRQADAAAARDEAAKLRPQPERTKARRS